MSHLQVIDSPCLYLLADSQPGCGNIYLADVYFADMFLADMSLADIVLRVSPLCL